MANLVSVCCDKLQRKLIKIVIRLGEMTARLLERVHARPLGCTDSYKLEMSLQLTSLREHCARLLEAVDAGEIAGQSAARLFGSYHSKLRVLLAVHGGGHLDAAAAPPLAVPPPGGQIDRRLLAKFGIYAFELPTNWVDRSLIASMMRTLDCAMDEAKDFMSVTDEQDEAEEGEDDGNASTAMRACCYYQPLRLPCPSIPLGHKPQQHNLFLSSSSSSSSSRSKDVKLRAILDEDRLTGARPWYSLFGMSFFDLYDHFPESVWDICEDSPADAIEKKEHKGWMQLRNAMNNRYTRALDTNFDESFVDSIVFDKTLYKYAILGCKVNADGIMNEGIISSSERNKIIHAIERIEDDIEIENVHTSIVEALADMIGDQAKGLAVESKCDSCLMILETWSKNSIDHIMTQLKQLQAALVLLAIKNDGFVLRGEKEIEGTSLLMRIVKALDSDASKLRNCLGGICSTDGVIFLRLSSPEDYTLSKLSYIAWFANSINYRIPNLLRQLLEKVLSLRNAETAIYETTLGKLSSIEQMRHHGDVAISKCLNLRFGKACGSLQTCEIEDAKHHLFSSTKSVVEILDLSIQLVKSISFDMEKAQNCLPRGYDDVMRFAHFLTTKGIDSVTAYALVHLCLDKQLQPSELTLDKHELKQIDFHCERAHYLLEYKGSIFGDSTDLDACKQMLKWCSKLRIDPAATICS
uniref:Uncharacterized protein n=1 Tax=Oryza meridionalis TaxID=40149 RepID=A0A0E0D8Y5_9ORYZ